MTDREAIELLEFNKKNYPNALLTINGCWDAAISALKEREERSKGCDWCNGIIEALNSSFGIYESKGEYRISTDESDTVLNFCPMCGRLLRENKK